MDCKSNGVQMAALNHLRIFQDEQHTKYLTAKMNMRYTQWAKSLKKQSEGVRLC